MITIHTKLENPSAGATRVEVVADRFTLAKTRWRGTAVDGTDFGFDLHQPLRHDDVFHEAGGVAYFIRQKTEPVLELCNLPGKTQAALVGWAIGNLHQSIEVLPDCVRVPDDPSLRRLFETMEIEVKPVEAVFQPVRVAGHAHGHSH